jgi:hypothetical protein
MTACQQPRPACIHFAEAWFTLPVQTARCSLRGVQSCVQPAIAPNNVLADAQAAKHAAQQAAAAGEHGAGVTTTGAAAGADAVPVTDLSAPPASPLLNGASAAASPPAEGADAADAGDVAAAAAVAAMDALVEQYGGDEAQQEVCSGALSCDLHVQHLVVFLLPSRTAMRPSQ